ncbi:MAG TPA: hypothetical protein VI076_03815 [Actinopolymorphaceae bacterium]
MDRRRRAPRPSEYGSQARVFFARWHHETIGLVINGESLFASWDRGRSWRQEALPGVDSIGGIDANRSSVFVVGHSRRQTDDAPVVTTKVFSSPIGRRHWKPVRGLEASSPGGLGSTLSDVAAQDKAVQVSVSTWGGTVTTWSARNGHRFVSASPCDRYAATRVGIGAGDTRYALCSYNPDRGSIEKRVTATTDGETYEPVAMAPKAGVTSDFASVGDTIAIGATAGDAAMLHLSVDGGRTWAKLRP